MYVRSRSVLAARGMIPPERWRCWIFSQSLASDEVHTMSKADIAPMAQTALRYDMQVSEQGRVELHVPFPAGARVTVFVIEESADTFDDLLSASRTSLDFWNNRFDDEDWNNA